MRLSKLKIHVTVPILLLAAVFFDFFASMMLVYGVVLMHELAHVFMAHRLGVSVKEIEVLPFGITMRLDSHYVKEPRKEILIAIAGPMSNIVMAGILIAFGYRGVLLAANISIAALNFMPALPLDGGRVLRAALTQRWGFVKALNFTMTMTKILGAVLGILGIGVFAYSGFNFSVLLISTFLICNVVAEKRVGDIMMMRDVLYSREKLTEGSERAAYIVAKVDEPARKLLKLFGYNNYYMVDVVGENMEVVGTLTETQVIDGIIDKGSRVKVGELT